MIPEKIKTYLPAVFHPPFFTLIKNRQYSKQTFRSDLLSGLIVGVIAIPLGIAFSTAAGLSPDKGLITCIIASLLVAVFGGSSFQIAGPTGAFIVVIDGILTQYGQNGMQALIIATVIAGVMLALMGIVKLGDIMKFIPYPITVGLTSGIAFIIFSYQIKDFFGLQIAAMPAVFTDKWVAYITNFPSFDWYTALIGVATVIVIILFPKITKKIPVYLFAIVSISGIAFLLHQFFGLELDTIGSKFPELSGGASIPRPQAPPITVGDITALIQPAFTIAILCAIQSTLSAMVADGMTGKKYHANTELIGQGLANIFTPFFGGIPSAGAIARTVTNVNTGGKTPIASLIHALFLVFVLLFLMPLATHIPLACLAGILVMVAYKMSEWRTFKALFNNSRSDVIVLLTTFLLTVIAGLTLAVELGLLMALLLFLRRVMETSNIAVISDEIKNSEHEENNQAERLDIPAGVEVYEINGPFFFGMANTFDEIDGQTGKRAKIRIIRMRKVPFIDSTGLHNLENLWKRSQKEKTQIILSGVTDSVRKTIEKSGFANKLGAEFICSHIHEAITKARSMTL